MKYFLILLTFACSVALSASQPQAPSPVAQVIAGPAGTPSATGGTGAVGADGMKDDKAKSGNTLLILPQHS